MLLRLSHFSTNENVCTKHQNNTHTKFNYGCCHISFTVSNNMGEALEAVVKLLNALSECIRDFIQNE